MLIEPRNQLTRVGEAFSGGGSLGRGGRQDSLLARNAGTLRSCGAEKEAFTHLIFLAQTSLQKLSHLPDGQARGPGRALSGEGLPRESPRDSLAAALKPKQPGQSWIFS